MPAITPDEAVALVDRVMSEGGRVEAVDIAGPGEPLATPHATFECLSRLHRNYPALELGMVTNGLGGALLVDGLRESGLKKLTLCVDAITTVTAEKIYAWIRPGARTVPLAQAAVMLVNEQAATASVCARVGLAVQIATTVYPGFNDGEVEEIALKMAGLGAEGMTLIPYQPMPGDMGCLLRPSAALMARASVLAARHLKMVEEGTGQLPGGRCCPSRRMPDKSLPRPSAERPNVAVTSHSGMAIDQHLGQAARLLIYGPREDGLVCLLEARPAPGPGSGSDRWRAMAARLPDCFALLTAAAGETPRAVLRSHGVPLLITDGEIEGTVDVLYREGRKKKS
jgi:nitrogen fixation protein NifB